ncbi:YlaH-like family protein [Paenibacillus arenilitoris]|uniref:YlaH-like family protein n=1 Tax=Paenibacillus arenilitoris TaxID=2772299 RepID=A0A927CMI5_9BACL|nr:YlaH-like family protein [Paenibacillus arenilitoris]MBD2870150.1 YlaH-like family protein [Paenibacillus arenilitoris]
MQAWLSDHKLVSYLLILGFTIYIFNKVFRPQQKLPLLKEILVYVLIAFGSFILMILQVDKLPIIQCMGVAVIMMLMLRGRQLYDKWKGNKAGDASAQGKAEPGK